MEKDQEQIIEEEENNTQQQQQIPENQENQDSQKEEVQQVENQNQQEQTVSQNESEENKSKENEQIIQEEQQEEDQQQQKSEQEEENKENLEQHNEEQEGQQQQQEQQQQNIEQENGNEKQQSQDELSNQQQQQQEQEQGIEQEEKQQQQSEENQEQNSQEQKQQQQENSNNNGDEQIEQEVEEEQQQQLTKIDNSENESQQQQQQQQQQSENSQQNNKNFANNENKNQDSNVIDLEDDNNNNNNANGVVQQQQQQKNQSVRTEQQQQMNDNIQQQSNNIKDQQQKMNNMNSDGTQQVYNVDDDVGDSQDSQVFSYQADNLIYALGFSNHSQYKQRIGIGSFVEETDNKVQIIQLNEETQQFEEKLSFNHKYPPTKLLFCPESNNMPDILATSGESLKIWEIKDNEKVSLKCDLINQNEFSAPLTSFDWNPENLQLIGTASIDTTCTIWDIEKQTVYTQLIAHDKEVYDISFSCDKNLFASVGADGSARQFDLRNLEHSTVLYETEGSVPLLKLAWNRNDPKYVAVIEMDQNHVTLLDTRVPMQPVAKFQNHKNCVNALAWAPQSSCHLCTCADDSQALIWDLSDIKNDITDPLLEYKAEGEISNLSWSTRQNEWLAICFGSTLQILKVQ